MALVWTLPDPVSGCMSLQNPSRSGGVAANGQEQNVGTMSMRQTAQWTIPIRRPAEIKAARALFAQARGKAESILVPVFEPKFARTATLSAAAANRATTIHITLTAGPAPEAGRHFGIGNRAYMIWDTDHPGGTSYDLDFWPPLRAAAALAAPVLFDTAVCEMNLATDENPVMLDIMRYATLDLSFVEAF